MSILTLDSVVYQYGKTNKSAIVLDHVSAEFETGVLYAIVGKSGSGKSTLLSLAGGLDVPVSGSVRYMGTDTRDLDRFAYRRKNVAVVYQDFSLFALLTVLENIMYPASLCRIDGKTARHEALSLANKVQLPNELLNRYPGEISGGEQQRTAIARALTMNRRLLLADEPTGNLDAENSENIMNLLLRLAHEEQCCVIVVTHDPTVAEKADVRLLMQNGRLLKDRPGD